MRPTHIRAGWVYALAACIAVGSGVIPRYLLAQSFTYDFPGTPGTVNPGSQPPAPPAGGTFSNWALTGITEDSGGPNILATLGWSSTGAINLSQSAGYSVTPS